MSDRSYQIENSRFSHEFLNGTIMGEDAWDAGHTDVNITSVTNAYENFKCIDNYFLTSYLPYVITYKPLLHSVMSYCNTFSYTRCEKSHYECEKQYKRIIHCRYMGFLRSWEMLGLNCHCTVNNVPTLWYESNYHTNYTLYNSNFKVCILSLWPSEAFWPQSPLIICFDNILPLGRHEAFY